MISSTSFLYIFKEIISFVFPILNIILLFYIALMLKKIYDVINEK
jgi:hypothetical protein